MLCEMCNKNEATVTIVKVVGMSKTEINVCNECANYLLGNTVSSFSFSQKNLNELLINLLNAFSRYNGEENYNISEVEIKCPNCGQTYTEFIESGKYGCSKCYEIFNKQNKPLLNRLHGYSQHKGKIPNAVKIRLEGVQKIAIIKDELQKAVSKEEYEKAARLRDLIIEEEKRVGIKNNE